MHPDLNFTGPILPNIPPPILFLFCISPSSWLLALPPSPRYSLLTFPHSSPLLQTLPHSSSLLPTCPPSCLLVPTLPHFCLLFLTPTKSSSLFQTLRSSSSLIFPHAHFISLFSFPKSLNALYLSLRMSLHNLEPLYQTGVKRLLVSSLPGGIIKLYRSVSKF